MQNLPRTALLLSGSGSANTPYHDNFQCILLDMLLRVLDKRMDDGQYGGDVLLNLRHKGLNDGHEQAAELDQHAWADILR